MTAYQTLGQRIASLRRQRGLTQDQLAERLGISAQAVSSRKPTFPAPTSCCCPLWRISCR